MTPPPPPPNPDVAAVRPIAEQAHGERPVHADPDDEIRRLRAAGCRCEFGCSNCGYALASMGNCPAWGGCPVGRATVPDCPVHVRSTPGVPS